MNFSFVKIPFTCVRISIFLILILAAMLYADPSVYTALVIACAAVHELGHIVAMKHFGVKIQSIYVYPFGAVISSDAVSLSYKKEAVTALAGAGANILTAALSLIVFVILKDSYSLFFCVCSLFLAAINLVPVKTFDGGIALVSALSLYFAKEKALKIAETVSYLSFVFLAFSALMLLIVTGCNFSLLIFFVYVFTFAYARENN